MSVYNNLESLSPNQKVVLRDDRGTEFWAVREEADHSFLDIEAIGRVDGLAQRFFTQLKVYVDITQIAWIKKNGANFEYYTSTEGTVTIAPRDTAITDLWNQLETNIQPRNLPSSARSYSHSSSSSSCSHAPPPSTPPVVERRGWFPSCCGGRVSPVMSSPSSPTGPGPQRVPQMPLPDPLPAPSSSAAPLAVVRPNQAPVAPSDDLQSRWEDVKNVRHGDSLFPRQEEWLCKFFGDLSHHKQPLSSKTQVGERVAVWKGIQTSLETGELPTDEQAQVDLGTFMWYSLHERGDDRLGVNTILRSKHSTMNELMLYITREHLAWLRTKQLNMPL